MNYYDAARVRRTGLGDLMADKLVSGQGIGASIGGAISQKFKAKVKVFKEKFDLLNMAKFLFFGNKTLTTLFGKAIGRSAEDIGYFTGVKERRRYMRGVDSIMGAPPPPQTVAPKNSGKSKKLLKNILNLMEKSREIDLEQQEEQSTYDMLNVQMENDRHKEVIDVLVEATKVKNKAEKEMKRQAAKREKELQKREKAVEGKLEIKKPPTVPEKPATQAATRVAEIAKSTATAARAGAPLIAATAGVSIIGSEIAKGESAKGSYNAANKGTRENKIIAVKEKLNLEEMTIEEIMRRQAIKWGSANENEKLFAVGKYQVIPDTLRDAVAKLKISPKEKFTGQLQEKIFTDYLIAMKRPAIVKYLNSSVDDPKLLHDAVKQLSLEWASIADPDIPGGKSSHYGSGNKASMTVEQAKEFLRKDREINQSKAKATQIPSQTNVSEKVDANSKQVADTKKDMVQQSNAPVIMVNHNSQTIQQKTVMTPAKPVDINPMVR